jgi:hypothetical protein
MLHFQTIVSRKTPFDGRLEIPESLSIRLADAESTLTVRLEGAESPVNLEVMACNCAKSTRTGQHEHHFLSAEILRALPPGMPVMLAVDVDSGQVRIEIER